MDRVPEPLEIVMVRATVIETDGDDVLVSIDGKEVACKIADLIEVKESGHE